MRWRTVALFFAALALAMPLMMTAGGPAQAQSSGNIAEARARAYFQALSSGDAAQFEAMARENFSAELFARRTAAERASIVAQMSSAFGRIEITSIDIDGAAANVSVRGGSGLNGEFVFEFDSTPDAKIISIGARLGGDPSGAGSSRMPPPPIQRDMSAHDMTAALDAWIAPAVGRDDFAGVVLIAHDGRPVAVRAYGPARRTPNIAANANTSYNIASLGKRFTQTAIARLIQEGRISLRSTIGELLPDYPNAAARPATIEQLIAMQGDIADIFSPERSSIPQSRFASNHDYYQFVSSLPQRFAPGSRTEYCNGCYVVLAEIVERVSRMRFENYVQRYVFDPARMTRTGYFRRDRLPANTAISYARENPDAPYLDVSEQEGMAGCGAGGLYSTVGDLLAFDNALRDGRLLNAEQSGWVLGGPAMPGRNTTLLAIEGGGPGASALIQSDGRWSVIMTSNTRRPLPFDIATALARRLGL